MNIRIVDVEGIEEGFLAADDITALDGTIIVRKGMEIEGKHMRLFKRSVMHKVRVIVPEKKLQPSGKPIHIDDYPMHLESLKAKRIMVVDDSKFVRFKLEKTLTEAGMTVVGTATNGKEAIDTALQLKPDVVTLDIEMPNHDGLSAIRPIKEALPDVLIIMISSVEEDDKVLQALSSGAADFITKPIEPEKVLKTIIGNIVADVLL